ncbi:MAG: hypothetical protein H6670_08800 [Anaerolineaceae bacterium]|nr:hypothetical protein [Anaerolineaceae bacterium]
MLFEQYEQDTIEEDGDRLARISQSIAVILTISTGGYTSRHPSLRKANSGVRWTSAPLWICSLARQSDSEVSLADVLIT